MSPKQVGDEDYSVFKNNAAKQGISSRISEDVVLFINWYKFDTVFDRFCAINKEINHLLTLVLKFLVYVNRYLVV